MQLSEYRRQAEEAARWLEKQGAGPVDVAVLSGSGLSALAAGIVDDAHTIPLEDAPHLPPPTVAGHGREVVYGRAGGLGVLVYTGWLHPYEGHDAATCGLPVAIAHGLGARLLLLTNSAGALNQHLHTGALMLHSDFINFQHDNPWLHLGVADSSQRFVNPAPAYHPGASQALLGHLRRQGGSVHAGTYIAVKGPVYETRAELAMMRSWGADAVGMSTVQEVLMAHLLELPVCAVSAVTNECFEPSPVSHGHVVSAGAQTAPLLAAAFRSFLEDTAWHTEFGFGQPS
jgi:purine-nucleoside phosphorylase